MRQIFFLTIASAILFSCQKSRSPKHPPRIVSDTLMVYNQQLANGKINIYSRSFKTGEVKNIIFNGTHPFATNLRLVYIKAGNPLGFSRVDGITRLLIPLTQPSSPSLSLDSRLICLIDKISDTSYQLLKYDTLGTKTPLFETKDELSSPAFTSDGLKVVFARKTTPNSSSLFMIDVMGGIPKRITPAVPDSYDEYPTITNFMVYFVRSRIIDSTLSSEIFSSDFSGSSITQLTNFTNNWTAPSFFIKHLRKVSNAVTDSSALMCVSNYNHTNSDIYVYKVGAAPLQE